MQNTVKRPLVTLAAAGVMALGAGASPALAANQSGLVNVDLSGNTVQVPVSVAAAICGVQANVIAADNFGGNARCTDTSRSTATGGGGGGGGATNQDGLINVAITDNTVQVPIGVAVTICGVQANVLASGNFGGNAVCEAVTDATANA